MKIKKSINFAVSEGIFGELNSSFRGFMDGPGMRRTKLFSCRQIYISPIFSNSIVAFILVLIPGWSL